MNLLFIFVTKSLADFTGLGEDFQLTECTFENDTVYCQNGLCLDADLYDFPGCDCGAGYTGPHCKGSQFSP